MTLIDGDRIITAQLYDGECEEFTEKKMSIIDYINAYTDEGVTEADVIGTSEQTHEAIKMAVKALSLPSAERKGKWIRHTRVEPVYSIDGVETWGIKCQCNKCCFSTTVVEDFGYYNFCPNCGAKME